MASKTPINSELRLRQGGANNKQLALPSNLPMPRTILARDRSVLDKMVEYLIGDGPNNRFALICKNCSSHNGKNKPIQRSTAELCHFIVYYRYGASRRI